ncbi:erythromycin esterase family protein [Chryseobacterium indologenes]|uniref:Erythromycin esterase n=1 Tax=Chryseobacterium indologenes TaxID=253 RepID=A0A0N0ZVC5_CHRID|nr:erythromycin esterase family protein [Chryseobacterium indologenes]KPE49899.1 hypothetical protein AOB46_17035 [Chryseobacterium indologenes]
MKKQCYPIIFTLFVFLISFNTQAQKKNLTEEEKAYLKKFIYPLKSVEPEYPEVSDLKIFDNLIGTSKIVALGEVSHGSSEIYKMKDRLVRYLIPNNNFSIFSLEASMPESYMMNEFTMNGEGDPKVFLEGMKFWIWQTEEMLSIVNWIKKYNETGSRQVQFTGFDMLYTGGAIEEIKKICTVNSFPQDDITQLSEVIKAIDEQSNGKSKKTNITSDQKETLNILLENLKLFSRKIKDEKEKNWFLQNLRIIEQNTDKSAMKRDLYMAQNIGWIHSQNPDARMIVSAHNGHISNYKAKMGEYLKRDLKNDYTTFGFTFYSGNYTAFDQKSRTVGSFPAQTAYEGTAEYLLNSLDIPIFVLDLKSLRQENSEAARWITRDEIRFRRTGSTVVSEEFQKTNISADFDYLIFIKESAHSRLLEK